MAHLPHQLLMPVRMRLSWQLLRAMLSPLRVNDADYEAVEATSKYSGSECVVMVMALVLMHMLIHMMIQVLNLSLTLIVVVLMRLLIATVYCMRLRIFSCLKEMERRQRYGNCLFTNLNKEPQRTICTLSSLMYASALAEYECCILIALMRPIQVLRSDNTMYILHPQEHMQAYFLV